MQRSRPSFMIIISLVFLLSLGIQLAEGMSCYKCENSECNRKGGEVLDCSKTSGGNDRCVEGVQLLTDSKDVVHYRYCASKSQEELLKKHGFSCDDIFLDKHRLTTPGNADNFGVFDKVCFCSTDLCNENLFPADNGSGGPLTPEEVLTCKANATATAKTNANAGSVITGFSQIFFGTVAYFLFKGFFQ